MKGRWELGTIVELGQTKMRKNGNERKKWDKRKTTEEKSIANFRRNQKPRQQHQQERMRNEVAWRKHVCGVEKSMKKIIIINLQIIYCGLEFIVFILHSMLAWIVNTRSLHTFWYTNTYLVNETNEMKPNMEHWKTQQNLCISYSSEHSRTNHWMEFQWYWIHWWSAAHKCETMRDDLRLELILIYKRKEKLPTWNIVKNRNNEPEKKNEISNPNIHIKWQKSGARKISTKVRVQNLQ